MYTHVLCVGVFMRTQGECKEPGGLNFSAEHLWMPGRISQALKVGKISEVSLFFHFDLVFAIW
jgi:hypothetical protein